MTEHRPASDEALERTIPLQAGFLTLVCWIWEVVAMKGALFTTPFGLALLVGTIPFCYYLTRVVRAASAVIAFFGGVTR